MRKLAVEPGHRGGSGFCCVGAPDWLYFSPNTQCWTSQRNRWTWETTVARGQQLHCRSLLIGLFWAARFIWKPRSLTVVRVPGRCYTLAPNLSAAAVSEWPRPGGSHRFVQHCKPLGLSTRIVMPVTAVTSLEQFCKIVSLSRYHA